MKAEDRYEQLETELKNLITPMSEPEQELLMRAIRWACRDNRCGRMSALAKLLVWSDPDTNVGGIWSVEDVDAQLEYMESNEIEVSFITHEMKQELLQDWYDYISENDSNLWGDFVYSRVTWLRHEVRNGWLKHERGYFRACAFADDDGNVSWENYGGIWYENQEEHEWIEDSRGLTEEQATSLAEWLNKFDEFKVALSHLDMTRVEQEIANWEKNNG